jgi:hypothetical protein
METDWEAALTAIERSMGVYRELATREPKAFESLLTSAAKTRVDVLNGRGCDLDSADLPWTVLGPNSVSTSVCECILIGS